MLQSLFNLNHHLKTQLHAYILIYYIEDKKRFIDNCYNWLKPGGYFVVHLVNRDKFDPIVNSADPLHIVSAQSMQKIYVLNKI